MGFGFFSWLRSKAREAVLMGCSDALEELDRELDPADLEAARKRFGAAPEAKALPAAKGGDDEPKKGRGK